MSILDPNGLFASATSPTKPFIGMPGEGGIPWSKGFDVIDGFYPDYSPPTPGSGSAQSPLLKTNTGGVIETNQLMLEGIEEAAASQNVDRPLLYGIEDAALVGHYDIWDYPTLDHVPTPRPPLSNLSPSEPDLDADSDVIMSNPVIPNQVVEEATPPRPISTVDWPADYDCRNSVSPTPAPSSQLPIILLNPASNNRSSRLGMSDQMEDWSVADTLASDLGNSGSAEKRKEYSDVAMDSLVKGNEENIEKEGKKSSDKGKDAASQQAAPSQAQESLTVTAPQASQLDLQRNTSSK
jgi:hypothetical protein